MSNQFIQQRHALYQTPENLIFNLLKQTTGQTPIQRAKITRGYDSEVYAIKTEQQEIFIVRIQQHGSVGFAEEHWAINRSREAGAPVPDVCFVGTLRVNAEEKPVMIQRKVPGRALIEIQAQLSEPELAYIYAQAGVALSRIHSVHVGGFYRMQPDGTWDFPDWESIVNADQKDRAAERDLLRQIGFTNDDVDRMLTVNASRLYTGAPPRPVLCHGDFGPDHLFVDQELNLTAVIDFGDFQGGLPILDFVILSIYYPDVDLKWLQAGYEDKSLFNDRFELELRGKRVGYLMGYLAHCVKIGDHDEIRRKTTQLRDCLSLLGD